MQLNEFEKYLGVRSVDGKELTLMGRRGELFRCELYGNMQEAYRHGEEPTQYLEAWREPNFCTNENGAIVLRANFYPHELEIICLGVKN